ncbi:arsenic metallochaperone ArsD family protein [Listeria booriae]|uniref:Arsenic metallochaperone ArsD family protein n=1 Tax=Listeria booriae TaxID=1552123 RepID=A0A7X1DPQ0_9LIST|nr:arsenic metallochaperone ArsD family protein [Listeria booriae]MBC2370811.1 arsenic metallochaperone ArsD family protein [Listeria booriae]
MDKWDKLFLINRRLVTIENRAFKVMLIQSVVNEAVFTCKTMMYPILVSKAVRSAKMIKLTFFLDSRDSLKQSDEVELELFNSIFDKEFQESHLFVKEEQIVLDAFYLEDSLEPFLKNDEVIRLLKKDGSKALPITLQDEEIISTKKLPSVDDFSEIFDMGISVQYSDEG